MKYKAHVDGLRALSIIPVILYHLDLTLFSGGFIGVDIFFVISGFLITSIIIDEFKLNKFSLLKFYERRIRRIIPILFFVIFVTSITSLILLSPKQILELNKSIISALFFFSNIFFWMQDGYFTAPSEEKQLLHTWSLSIEEQYYIFFPILFLIFFRKHKFFLFAIIISVFLISFFLSNYASKYHPSANFFLLPFRIWEILAGSLVAFLLHKNETKKSNFLSIIGFLLIILSIFFFSEKTPTPSFYTFIPILGVGLILIYSDKDTLVSKFLSHKILVTVGLMSYSLYLWHFPIVSFFKTKFNNLSHLDITFIILLSFILSYGSWKYIEKPFRHKNKVSLKLLIIYITIFLIFLISFSVIGIHSKGFKDLIIKYRYMDDIRYELVLNSTEYEFEKKMINEECKIWIKNVEDLRNKDIKNCYKKYEKFILIFGDSHAMTLHNILSKNSNFNFIISIAEGGFRVHNKHDKLKLIKIEKFIIQNKNKIKNIIYIQSGSHFMEDENSNVDTKSIFEGKFLKFSEKNISETINYLDYLSKKIKKKVLWIGPYTQYRYDPIKNFNSPKAENINPISVDLFSKLNQTLINLLKENKNINFKKFDKIFEEPKTAFLDNCFIFYDMDHYSTCGESYISSKLANIDF